MFICISYAVFVEHTAVILLVAVLLIQIINWNPDSDPGTLFFYKENCSDAEPKLFISGSDFVHNFGSSYSHILALKTVL